MACPTPYVRNINGYKVPVPCGRCLACRIDRRNEWTWRLAAELKGVDGMFVTLTIADEHLLPTRSVYKASVQRFFKRFRKNLSGREIKYFAVSEYGELDFRPHYHAIVTNCSCGKPLTADLGDIPIVKKSWPFGFIKCEPASKSSIRYVLKYLDKMQGVEDWKKEFPSLNPPFRLMSKGIGAEWILKQAKMLLNEDNLFYYDGKFRPLPRYYKEKLGLVDRFREDYSDVSVSTRLDSPARAEKILDFLRDNPRFKEVIATAGWSTAVASVDNVLGRQYLLDLEKKIVLGNKSYI